MKNSVQLFSERVELQAGLQYPFFDRQGTNLLPLGQRSSALGVAAERPSKADDAPLPSFGITWRAAAGHQLFASAGKTFRPPQSSALFDTVRDAGQHPETAIVTEAGYRFSNGDIAASLSGFRVGYQNRQQSTFDSTINASVDRNVGNVELRGLQLEAGTALIEGFSLYTSLTYTESEISNDIIVGSASLPTRGKKFVDTPDILAAIAVRYDRDDWFASVQTKYTSSRYATLVNDESVSAYTTTDVSLGLRLPVVSFVKERPVVLFSITNLFDTSYLGRLNFANNRYAVNGVGGSSPSYVPGAPRFISVKLTVSM